jgi:hypothetical protein
LKASSPTDVPAWSPFAQDLLDKPKILRLVDVDGRFGMVQHDGSKPKVQFASGHRGRSGQGDRTGQYPQK